MKKVLLILAAALLTATFSFAQISTGAPTATKIKTGNRPTEGTFGLYFGGEMFLDGTPRPRPYFLPVINVKYFLSDNLELRAGLDVLASSSSYNGKKLISDIYDDDLKTYTRKAGGTDLTEHLTFCPGAAWHFSKSNILDVYVGAEIPLGYQKWTDYTAVIKGKDDLPPGILEQSTSITYCPFIIGTNLLIGLQAFIGNLPLAIGFEYGIGAYARFGDKYRVVQTQGDDNKATYYVNGDVANEPDQITAAVDKFHSLSTAAGVVGHTLRATISYYFK